MKTDTDLHGDVMNEIRWDPKITSEHIGIIVSNRVVTLIGYVPNFAEKRHAERAAERVTGVKAVADELEVKIPDTSLRDDSSIAKADAEAMKWHVSIPQTVKAVVDGGLVSLTGDVEWYYQKESAEVAIKDLIGVRGIINNINVKPTIKPALVKDKIRDALRRIAVKEAGNINVEIEGSKVILKGTVHSWDEYWAAKNAAWAAPGVSAVESAELSIAA